MDIVSVQQLDFWVDGLWVFPVSIFFAVIFLCVGAFFLSRRSFKTGVALIIPALLIFGGGMTFFIHQQRTVVEEYRVVAMDVFKSEVKDMYGITLTDRNVFELTSKPDSYNERLAALAYADIDKTGDVTFFGTTQVEYKGEKFNVEFIKKNNVFVLKDADKPGWEDLNTSSALDK